LSNFEYQGSTAEHLRANAILAEQTVIGEMLKNPEQVLPEAVSVLTEADFLLPEYAAVFEACRKLYFAQRGIDPISAGEAANELCPMNWKEILYKAAGMVIAPSCYKDHIQVVASNAKRARARKALVRLDDLMYESAPVSDLREAASNILRCFEDNGQAVSVHIGELFSEFLQRKSRPVEYLKTGFGALDKRACISSGDYVIVGGRPSTGKTALTLQIALNMAQRQQVAYFSLETSKERLVDRAVACKTRTRLDSIKRSEELTNADWKRMAESYPEFAGMKMHIVPAAGWTTDQIRAETVRLGAQVIFVDYLGLIRSTASSIYERVTQVSLDLHTMAQSLGVTVFALAQLNRAGKDAPGMESLRDSGQLEQDADIVLLLDGMESKMEEVRKDMLERKLIVAKNKDGQVGAIDMVLEGVYQRFSETIR